MSVSGTRVSDTSTGRRGQWMHTSLGGRFYPGDPRPEEVFISDIANGLALDNRYSGQNRVDRFYSVAEHSSLMALWCLDKHRDAQMAFVALLHDAHEAYGIRDVNVAAKEALGQHYRIIASRIQQAVWEKYHLAEAAATCWGAVKELDCRIVPTEKRFLMRHQQPWAADEFDPLPVPIRCLQPPAAKKLFVQVYWDICGCLQLEPEEIEI